MTAGDGTALGKIINSARYQIVGKTLRLHLDVQITAKAVRAGRR